MQLNGFPKLDILHYMIAIYTCFFGNNSNWANQITNAIEGIDCYYFTNNPTTFNHLESTKWKRVFVDIPISDDDIVSASQSKHLRCCPYEYSQLRPYQYICWIDSKLRIHSLPCMWDMVASLERTGKSWAFTQHPLSMTTVWDEYNEAIKYKKYAQQKNQYIDYIDSRIAMGYGEIVSKHICGGFSVRKQTPLAKEIGEFWYSEIQDCGIEDQISFHFVHQKYVSDIEVFPYQYCWCYA